MKNIALAALSVLLAAPVSAVRVRQPHAQVPHVSVMAAWTAEIMPVPLAIRLSPEATRSDLTQVFLAATARDAELSSTMDRFAKTTTEMLKSGPVYAVGSTRGVALLPTDPAAAPAALMSAPDLDIDGKGTKIRALPKRLERSLRRSLELRDTTRALETLEKYFDGLEARRR